MWGQMLPQSCAEQYPVLQYLCSSVTPRVHRDTQGDPTGQQEHGQLVSTANAENVQHRRTLAGSEGLGQFFLITAATYVLLTRLLL